MELSQSIHQSLSRSRTLMMVSIEAVHLGVMNFGMDGSNAAFGGIAEIVLQEDAILYATSPKVQK